MDAMQILFGIATIAAAVYAVLTYVHQRNRRVIEWGYSATRLLASSKHKGLVKIVVGEMVVADPYLVRLAVFYRGGRDIARDDFDGGHPLAFDVESGALVTAATAVNARQTLAIEPVSSSEEEADVLIRPTLLKRRTYGYVDLICDGPPTIKCRSPLRDVEVRESKFEDLGQPGWFSRLIGVGRAGPTLTDDHDAPPGPKGAPAP